MTAALSENIHKAMKAAKVPATKASKTLPILSHARIFTHDGHIVVQAVDTSGDTWELQAAAAPARVDVEFDTCVPIKPVEFTFDPKNQVLTVKERAEVSSRAKFKCIDSQEFPVNLPVKA